MLLSRKQIFLGAAVLLLVLGSAGFLFRGKIQNYFRSQVAKPSVPEVTVPTIINGELVLPKISTASADQPASKERLGVASANLVGVFAEQQGTSSPKLTGIRVIGEAVNLGAKIVNGLSPVVKFVDKDDKVIAQKIARPTSGFTFFDLPAGDKTLYDVTVDDPPPSDRLEIVLNPASFADKAVYEPLKIASRSMEIKYTDYQPQGTESAAQKITYYNISGAVVNPYETPVTEISIFAWVKDKEGKVFSFSRQDFKNDLAPPNDKIDFKLLLLPIQFDKQSDSYEVAAWAKKYQLSP